MSPDEEKGHSDEEQKGKCREAHPEARCVIKPRSFHVREFRAAVGRQPFPDLPPLWDADRAYKRFEVSVDFSSRAGGACCCCEYRQFVKGHLWKNDEPVEFHLPGGLLSPDEWREDGIVDHFGLGEHLTYGHRGGREDPLDEYLDEHDIERDRVNGCHYRGRDAVNLVPHQGERWVLDVDFEGRIIDVCHDVEVDKRAWHVRLATRP